MRRGGVLMHITSLPAPYGVGTMGGCARRFVDFLQAAGQSLWQLLPLGPTGYGDSPYHSFSTFAGNPYLIDLDLLAEEGLLEPGEYRSLDWGADPAEVDYGKMYRRRFPVLRRACGRLLEDPPAEFEHFCRENSFWLEDYARFMAFKEAHGGQPWTEWELPLRARDPAVLARVGQALEEDLAFWKGVQFLFFRQWKALKEYANRHGVYIVGDLPIYVPGDSADLWAGRAQFQLDEDLRPMEVAGCPPDGFSSDGQLWGNPLFDWDRMEREGYRWWVDRIAYQFRLYDVLRIDHFRGFDSYYAIPGGQTTAAGGRWRPGPGLKLFQAVEHDLGKKNIIAEDLGFLTPSVHQLRERTGFPGMKVLQFAFDSRDGEGAAYLPYNYPVNCVAYVGTHDNDTVQGWLTSGPPGDVARAREYLHLDREEGEHWGMLRAIWASPAKWAVAQMQDLLGLGSGSRMNTPATTKGNWRWRALPGFDSPALAGKLHRQMELYGRLPQE